MSFHGLCHKHDLNPKYYKQIFQRWSKLTDPIWIKHLNLHLPLAFNIPSVHSYLQIFKQTERCHTRQFVIQMLALPHYCIFYKRSVPTDDKETLLYTTILMHLKRRRKWKLVSCSVRFLNKNYVVLFITLESCRAPKEVNYKTICGGMFDIHYSGISEEFFQVLFRYFRMI